MSYSTVILTLVTLHSQIIERNMHVKVQMSEDKGGTILTAIEDYRVMGMYTKTYNKWFMSEKTK